MDGGRGCGYGDVDVDESIERKEVPDQTKVVKQCLFCEMSRTALLVEKVQETSSFPPVLLPLKKKNRRKYLKVPSISNPLEVQTNKQTSSPHPKKKVIL